MGATAYKTVFGVALAGTLGACGIVEKPERHIPGADLTETTLHADIYQGPFEFGKAINIFQDEFGITPSLARGSDGVDGGMCDYYTLAPEPAVNGGYVTTSKRHQTIKDSTTAMRVKDNLFVVTHLGMDQKETPSGFSTAMLPYNCQLQVVRYSDDPVSSHLGSETSKVKGRSYTGEFVPAEKTNLFDGRFAIRVMPYYHGNLWDTYAAACVYTAYYDGQSIDLKANKGSAYLVSKNGKGYKIDTSMTVTEGATCKMKITEFDLIKPKPYTPVGGAAPQTPAAPAPADPAVADTDPGQAPIEQGLMKQPSNIVVTKGPAYDVILQGPKIVQLDSNAIYPRQWTSSVNIEFSWDKGGSAGVDIKFLTGTLTRAVSAKLEMGDSLTAGVDLDGALCRKWKTTVVGRRRHATVQSPALGISGAIPFQYTEDVDYKAEPLCPAK